MTGRENCKRAVECRAPDYLPTTVGVGLDWLYDKNERKRERVRALAA